MGKRPSLAETMRQVATTAAPQVVPLRPEAVEEPISAPERPALASQKPFFAATRAGKKKVTAALAPADHKRLKSLAVDLHFEVVVCQLTDTIHGGIQRVECSEPNAQDLPRLLGRARHLHRCMARSVGHRNDDRLRGLVDDLHRQLFAHAGKFDRLAGDAPQAQRGTAAGIAIELREDGSANV